MNKLYNIQINIDVKFMIQNMHGKYRIPTMLKLVDQLSRKI